ncbi:hypothetical protein NQ318_012561 [Aromia moschata]|uniref:Mos1 transposase HTH domain-containing protein n=1 Tax=Aromia moschata TaxID=1265417 RepID=A0AAV8YMA7_9CUCU|nr:hypothetical protein NQ318_012561 [Aromia moschata]
MSNINLEQRGAIRFCFRLGHSARVTFAKLQHAYGASVFSRAQVFGWFKAFSEGRESIEDKPRSGRNSSSRTDENVDGIRDLVRSHRQLTTRMIGKDFLNHTTVKLLNEAFSGRVCVLKMSNINLEQRGAIRFCFRLGHSARVTFAKLQHAYGASVFSRAQVFGWFKAFSEGRESIEDKPRSGRNSSSRTDENVDGIRDLVRSHRQLTTRMIGKDFLNHTTVKLLNEAFSGRVV